MVTPVDPAHVPYGEGVDLTRDLLDRSPLPVVIFTEDQVVLYANEPFERVFGYTRAEVSGRPYADLFPERLRAELTGRVRDYLAQPDPEPLAFRPDYLAQRKDGTEFPIQYTATVLRNRHGVWVVVTIFDVSEQRRAEARIELLTRSYLTLARMNQAVVRAQDVGTLYADTCRVAVEQGGFLGAWIGEPDAGGQLVPVAVAGSLDAYIRGLVVTTDPALPTSRGPTGRAFVEGEPVASVDFGHDAATAPWHRRAKGHPIAASISLPLRRGGRTCAVLSLYADHRDAVEGETRDLLEGLAFNVSFALDKLADAARLARISAEREDLLARLIDAQETERRRIAADIHDEPVQSLAALDIRLGLLEQNARRTGEESLEQLQQVREIVSGLTTSLRDLIFALEPPDPGSTLTETVQGAADHVFADTGVRVDVTAEEVHLPDVVLSQGMRILKEALINARKHADPRVVTVTVTDDRGGALFTVTDDGTGLDDAATLTAARGHRGVRTMAERAELTGGSFSLRPTPTGGARVEFWLPGSEDR